MKTYVFELDSFKTVYADVMGPGEVNLFCPDGMDNWEEDQAWGLLNEKMAEEKRAKLAK